MPVETCCKTREALVTVLAENREVVAPFVAALRGYGHHIRLSGIPSPAQRQSFSATDLVVIQATLSPEQLSGLVRRIRTGRQSGVGIVAVLADVTDASIAECIAMGIDAVYGPEDSPSVFGCNCCALLRRLRESAPRTSRGRIGVSRRGKRGLSYLDVDLVTHVVAARNYTYVHACCEHYLSDWSIGELEESLPEGFLRVHRSHIVNVDAIDGAYWETRWKFVIRLADRAGTEIPVSRDSVRIVRAALQGAGAGADRQDLAAS